MKNVIITAGTIIFILTLITFQLECNDLLRKKQQLTFLAEEAAATAALCYDINAFAEGRMIFDEEEANRQAHQIIDLNLPKREIDVFIDYVDVGKERPYVKVEIRSEGIKATGIYEHTPYLIE